MLDTAPARPLLTHRLHANPHAVRRAAPADPARTHPRAHALRGVGDRALYISGVVPRSLHRTPVNVKYVHGIGESAYREVAGDGPLAVLGTLAHMFGEVADVIGDVVELGAVDEPGDLLAVYERWRLHGDPRDAKVLVRAGVMLDREQSDVVQ